MIAAVALGLSWAQGVESQSRSDADLLEDVEALIPEYQAALSARDARRLELQASARPSPTPTEVGQVGPIRIVTLPDELEVATSLFEEVWREDFPWIAESPSVRAYTFVFQWRAQLQMFEVSRGPDEPVMRIDLSRVWAPSREHAKDGIRDALARALLQDFPPRSPMSQWMTARGFPDEASAYRLLAISTESAAQGCYAGRIDACGVALGFGFADAAGRMPEWFTPEQRREMVERAAGSDDPPDGRIDRNGPSYVRCVVDNDASACDALLEGLEWVEWTPVSDRLRSHLLWHAVALGGDGAWGRALERRGEPMPDVLAHVAQRPVEELLADWRADLFANHPDVHAGLGGRGTRVLFWTLIFAAFAMRSTRWRLD